MQCAIKLNIINAGGDRHGKNIQYFCESGTGPEGTAEHLLSQLGISMSNAVSMFLHQVVLQRAILFGMKPPNNVSLNYHYLNKEQFEPDINRNP